MHINKYPNIDISIFVQGEQIPERNYREGPNNEGVACIQCQRDAKFTIRFSVNQTDELGFFIYFDGQPVTKFGTHEPIEVEVFRGIVLEENYIIPKEFKFSNEQGKIYSFFKNLI